MRSKIKAKFSFEVIRYAAALLLAIAIAIVIMILVSKEPGTALAKFLLGPLTKQRYMVNVIELMISLMFTGLGVALILRIKVFNIAAEGMFYAGGIVAATVGCMVSLPYGIHPLVAVFCAGLAGALIAFIPAIFHLKFEANIIVSSLMLNYIVFQVGDFVLKTFLRDPKVQARIISYQYKPSALIPQIGGINSGILVALLFVVVTYLFLYKTRWGYAVRVLGENSKFAKYSGIRTSRLIMLVQLVGGFIIGVGGGIQILGQSQRFTWEWRSGYGWDGLVVAVIAKYNPKMIPFAAFLLAYMRIGSDIMSRATDIPNEVVSIIQGIMIILIISGGFLSGLRQKLLIKAAKASMKEEV